MELALLRAYIKFSLNTFKKSTAESSLIHAEKEIAEIREAMLNEGQDDALLEEYVDAMMCLIHSAARCGFSADDIRTAFVNKLLKNMGRTWKRNPDNTYSHVK